MRYKGSRQNRKDLSYLGLMKASSYALTDPGNQRPVNEDYYLINEELGLFVVCDGVGGHVAGNLASEMCARTIHQFVSDNQNLIKKYKQDRSLKNRAVVAGVLQKAIQSASEKIYKMAEVDVLKRGMCTTTVALLLIDDFAIIGHVGDSRVYLSRAGQVHQLTEDHKFSVEMVKKGILTAEEAARSPHGNVLSRAVGIQEVIEVDTLQVELMAGDTFLLCTDGLADYVDRNTLKKFFDDDLPKIPEQLVNHAKKLGGRDNITAAIIRLEEVTQENDEIMNVVRKTEILGKIPIFRYLNYQEITKVLALANLKQYPQNSHIVYEGSNSEAMFIIASGSVAIQKANKTIAEKKKGEVFGEMGLFDHAPRSASILAKEATTVLVFHRNELLALLRKEPQLAVKLLWALIHELNKLLRLATENLATPKVSQQTDVLELPFSVSKDDPTWRS